MDDLKTCLGAMYFDSVMMRKGKRPACYGLTQSRPMKQPPLPARVKQLPDGASEAAAARARSSTTLPHALPAAVRTLPPPSVEKASLSIGYSVSLRSLEMCAAGRRGAAVGSSLTPCAPPRACARPVAERGSPSGVGALHLSSCGRQMPETALRRRESVPGLTPIACPARTETPARKVRVQSLCLAPLPPPCVAGVAPP